MLHRALSVVHAHNASVVAHEKQIVEKGAFTLVFHISISSGVKENAHWGTGMCVGWRDARSTRTTPSSPQFTAKLDASALQWMRVPSWCVDSGTEVRGTDVFRMS